MVALGARHRSSVGAFIGAALLGGCVATTSPTPPSPQIAGPSVAETAAGTVSDHGFTLSAVAEPTRLRAGEQILVETSLTNDGARPVTLAGSGTAIVMFTVTRLEDGLTSGPPWVTSDCVPYLFGAGQRLDVPFQKLGAVSGNEELMEAYYADPDLTLPAGTWQIDVFTSASFDDCGGEQLDLSLSLIVNVDE
jgi:hypothetical protein